MRIVYMGSPDFALRPLEALLSAGHELAAVISQPDKPRSRGRQTAPTAVKARALQLGLPVFTPEKINTPESLELLRSFKADLFVVVAYGKLLKPELFTIPPYGAVNIHASLLPAYRGAAPIHRAIINGETRTGVTIMYIDKGLDSGDMLLQSPLDIGPEEDTGSLHDRLSALGAEMIVRACEQIASGTARRIPQDHSRATVAPRLTKEDEAVDWGHSAGRIHDRIRGLSPWPGAYTWWRGHRLKLRASRVEEDTPHTITPGTLLSAEGDGPLIACGSGALRLLEVQPEGKARLSAGEFLRGYRPEAGEILGQSPQSKEE